MCVGGGLECHYIVVHEVQKIMLNSLYILYIPRVLVQCMQCLDRVKVNKAMAKHVKVDGGSPS